MGSVSMDDCLAEAVASSTIVEEDGAGKSGIRKNINNLYQLEGIWLHGNRLSGSIPLALFNTSTIKVISLFDNDLYGEIPKEINNFYQLKNIYLNGNHLSGHLPPVLFNISTLQHIFLDNNDFQGTLPLNMGYDLPNLEELGIGGNNLRGVLPPSLSNSTKLQRLEFGDNAFIGEIPHSLGNIRLLEYLLLGGNNLTSQGLNFITSLTKCQYLKVLDVSGNPLDGNLPISIGNLSALERFHAHDCKIRGRIPSEIGNLHKLIGLFLNQNYLTGPVPSTMKSIQALDLSNNFIDGSTLNTLCELENLYELRLDQNKILGSVPDCFGKLTFLRHLYISNNGLTSIPPTIWILKNLIELNLSSNSLNGSLHAEMGNLRIATVIDMSGNHFSGEIPNVFTNLQNLEYLHLDHNSFRGSIPDSLGKSIGLIELDLSHNNLTGVIPMSFEALRYLKSFDVSFNDLRGEIPSRGAFKNFSSQSFMFNEALCVDSRFHVRRFHVRPCHGTWHVSSTKQRRSKLKLIHLLIPLEITVTIVALILIFLLMRSRRNYKISCRLEPLSLRKLERITYYDLLEATGSYDESNLLGSGSYGSVYRGILEDRTFVAVKVFNLQMEGSFKSFETETQVLRNVRHRNLTKVISSCNMEDFKALILQYMSNGSLEKWLYSHNYFLSFMQRLNIMIDVASAIEYLHHGYPTPLVHCDLKPSNVLLDEDMVAHVSDFGITKLLGEGESISYTQTLATIGYIAPEYGLEGMVSTRCDVHSFGIMMMEVFTRKKPSDEMFVAGLSLKQWVSNSIPHAVIQIVDANLISPNEQHFAIKLKCLSSIMELALSCSVESPNARIKMKDVPVTLEKIKHEFLTYWKGN